MRRLTGLCPSPTNRAVVGVASGAPVSGFETVTGGPVRCMNRSKRLVGLLAARPTGAHHDGSAQRLVVGQQIGGHPTQTAESVAVGAQVVSQLVTVGAARVGFRPRGAPAGPGRVEGGRVHRHDRILGGQEPVRDQAAGALMMTGSCAGSSCRPSLACTAPRLRSARCADKPTDPAVVPSRRA